ncbi:MAG: protein translocase SEC61 complex subunit gamma [Candidatus Atabeyarchaeum deiterrae]|jgi:protein translocase SEC61 complex gamma subunit
MGIRSFFSNARRILKIASKPKRKEVWTTTKVVALGALLIGLFAFVIHLIFMVLWLRPTGTA